nr:uncharacterized protein LOC117609534 [Osmia lignaria]
MSSSDKSQCNQKQKRYSSFCSTPVLRKKSRKLSISESTIESSSSSNTKETSGNIIQRIIKRNKETKRKARKQKPKQRAKRKSDSDWETCVSCSPNDVLFKDIESPELLREAPCWVEERSESPILGSKKRLVRSPGKITFAEKEPFSSRELPRVHVSWDDTDDNEEALLTLRKEKIVRTYPGIRDKKQPKKPITIDKSKRWLVDLAIPTISSDLLWDDFVKNNVNVRKYLATCSKSEQKSSKKKSIKETCLGSTIPKGTDVVQGRWDKSSQKWIPGGDIYKFPPWDDSGIRMGLNEYLQRYKAANKGDRCIKRINTIRNLVSNEISDETTEPTATSSTTNGITEQATDVTVTVDKGQKITTKLKPPLVQILTTARYKKLKNGWKRIKIKNP